jgi:ATP-dependent Clp protease ATP-binding subunit ClpC
VLESTGRLLDPTLIGDKAESLKSYLKSSVIGQDEAIDCVVRGMSPYFAGACAPHKPIASMLFLGSTGVGKTYCVEQLAKHILGTDRGLVRISCESFYDRHEVAKLIGSPNGYIGSDEPAMLQQSEINKWRDLPKDELNKTMLSVILFDEVDKANPSLHSMLLGILDSGSLSLAKGRSTDFSQTIIIMTANWGSKDIAQLHDGGFGFVQEKIGEDDIHKVAMGEAKKSLSPELWNRIDTTVVFNALSEKDAAEVCECELGKVQQRMREIETPFLFSVNADVKKALLEEGYSAKYGARELKRVISRRLSQPFANLLSSGQIHGGDILKVYYSCGEYIFHLKDVKFPWFIPPSPVSQPPDDKPSNDVTMWPYRREDG